MAKLVTIIRRDQPTYIYSGTPCGCQIAGDGSAESPFEIELCPLHAAASDLLEACEAAERTYAALERNADTIVASLAAQKLPTSWLRLEIDKATKVRAAIAKAKKGA